MNGTIKSEDNSVSGNDTGSSKPIWELAKINNAKCRVVTKRRVSKLRPVVSLV